jgi:PAS domain S-box-containing protein
MGTDKKKILIVDDDRHLRVLLRAFLAKTGRELEIVEAESIAQARDLLNKERFDCLFLDYILSDDTGQSLIQFLKNYVRVTPVILLSNYLNAEIVAEMMRHYPIMGFLRKENCSQATVTEYLEKALAGGREEERLADAKTSDGSLSFEHLAGLTVLVVDDQKENLDLTIGWLEPVGLKVAVAQDGETAFKVAVKARPSLILLDIGMPGLNGFETCARLKADPQTRDIPVIFLTARTETEDYIRGLTLGGADYITKPVRVEELLARIRVHLSLKKLADMQAETIRRLDASVGERTEQLLETNRKLLTEIDARSRVEQEVEQAYAHLERRVRESTANLERSQAYLNSIVDNMVDGLIIIDQKGVVLSCNPAVEKWFGYSAVELIGHNVSMLMPEPHRSAHDGFLAAYLTTGKAKIIGLGRELEGQRKDGTVFPFVLAVSEIEANGEQRFIGTLHDITERKRDEIHLHKLHAFQQGVLHNAHNIIVATDLNGVITMFNPAAEQMLGWKEAEMVGRAAPAVFHDAAEVARRAEELSREMGRPIAPGHEVFVAHAKAGRPVVREWTYVRKDGSRFPVLLAVSMLVDRDGNPTGYVGIGSDITAQKLAEEGFIKAKEEAERANLAKSEFLSRMSHELRTPLNAILGFGQLLEMDPRGTLDEQQKSGIKQILSGGKHLLQLINEVLDLAKIESGNISLSLEPVNLRTMLAEVIGLSEPIAHRQDVRILPPRFADNVPCFAIADQTRLRQVLLNLIGNAVKYNHKHGTVTISVESLGADRLRINVVDTGRGVAKERLRELFVPFNRLDAETSNIEGTGIGLTISKKLMELMKGTIGVESEFGRGSRFYLDIAQAKDVREASVVSAHLKQETPFTADGGLRLVLYVEDNPANQELVKHILRTRPGVRLLMAPDAGLGIDLAAAHKPDLILMDINLPGMNGVKAMEILKSKAETRHIPVIAISANALPNDIEKALRRGFDDYVVKPINVVRFLKMVDERLFPKEGLAAELIKPF